MMAVRYREIAADLRRAIKAGEYPPGSNLPTHMELVERYQVSRTTVNTALGILEAERLIRGVPGQGVFVLDWRPIRVALSRYAAVLEPGGQLGPWETACQRAGVAGNMVPVEVGRELADIEVAKALGISAGEEVVRRSRHATIDGSAVQLHTAYYPARLAEGTPLAGAGKITGGVYGAMRAADMRPTSADEKVGTRPASAEEAAELALSPGAFVLTVDRVTHDDAGQALEFLRMVIDPARTELVYDGLPLAR